MKRNNDDTYIFLIRFCIVNFLSQILPHVRVIELTNALFPTPPDPRTTSLYSRMMDYKNGQSSLVINRQKYSIFSYTQSGHMQPQTTSALPAV